MPDIDHDLPLNCPRCGRPLRFVREQNEAQVYHCREDGYFHFRLGDSVLQEGVFPPPRHAPREVIERAAQATIKQMNRGWAEKKAADALARHIAVLIAAGASREDAERQAQIEAVAAEGDEIALNEKGERIYPPERSIFDDPAE